MLASALGAVLMFIPFIVSDGVDHEVFTRLNQSLKSNQMKLGLVGCISACLYAMLEEILDILFSATKRNYNRDVFWFILLSIIIAPYISYISLSNANSAANLIPCVSSVQAMLLYMTLSMILHSLDNSVWDRRTLHLVIPLIIIWNLLGCIGSFFPNRVPYWTSTVPIATTLAIFYYKSFKWYYSQFKKPIKSMRFDDILCSSYVVVIFLYTVIKMVASTSLHNYRFENDYQAKEFCIHIYCNTALVLACLALRNQIMRASLMKLQVIEVSVICDEKLTDYRYTVYFRSVSSAC